MIPKLIQRQGAQHIAEVAKAIAPVDGAALNPPRDVLELIPESVCRENTVLPLKLDGRVLHVAVVDASNIMLRDKLAFMLNKDIRLVEHHAAAIRNAIERHYRHTETESVDYLFARYEPLSDSDEDEANVTRCDATQTQGDG